MLSRTKVLRAAAAVCAGLAVATPALADGIIPIGPVGPAVPPTPAPPAPQPPQTALTYAQALLIVQVMFPGLTQAQYDALIFSMFGLVPPPPPPPSPPPVITPQLP